MRPVTVEDTSSSDPQSSELHAFAAIEALYAEVPRTACRGCGQCCRLTDDEMGRDVAVMFPLYAVEYVRIRRHVCRSLPRVDRDRILSVTVERPRHCPFLDLESDKCTIYELRPLVCRCYGVLNRGEIEQAAHRLRGAAPEEWLRAFVTIESSTVCPNVSVLEPEKLALHAERMVTSDYAMKLSELSWVTDFADRRRRETAEEMLGLPRIVQWTWGGFNYLRGVTPAWLMQNPQAFKSASALAG